MDKKDLIFCNTLRRKITLLGVSENHRRIKIGMKKLLKKVGLLT